MLKKRRGIQEKFANPYVAAKYGYIDDIIEHVIRGLE